MIQRSFLKAFQVNPEAFLKHFWSIKYVANGGFIPHLLVTYQGEELEEGRGFVFPIGFGRLDAGLLRTIYLPPYLVAMENHSQDGVL